MSSKLAIFHFSLAFKMLLFGYYFIVHLDYFHFRWFNVSLSIYGFYDSCGMIHAHLAYAIISSKIELVGQKNKLNMCRIPKKVISKLSHCSILVWCFIKESDHLFTWIKIKTYQVNAFNHVTDFSIFTDFVELNGQLWFIVWTYSDLSI